MWCEVTGDIVGIVEDFTGLHRLLVTVSRASGSLGEIRTTTVMAVAIRKQNINPRKVFKISHYHSPSTDLSAIIVADSELRSELFWTMHHGLEN